MTESKNVRMTARRVHEELKGKVDERTLFVLMALAEERSTQHQEIIELAKMVDHLATVMSQIVHIQGGMEEKIKHMRRDDVDAPTYVQSEDPSKDN